MLTREFRRTRHLWFSFTPWKNRLLFWSGAIAVGAAATAFAASSEHAINLFYRLISPSPWLALVVTPAGLALTAFLTRRYFPGAQGSGIPQTIAAIRTSDAALRSHLLSIRIAVGKIALTVLALLSGASLGREGPTVQVGASIMYALDRLNPMPRREFERGLILAGSAAGVAAAFNTPLAGVVFAIEEMSRSYEQRTSGTVLTAVIVAGIVSMALLGNYTYFGHTPATLVDVNDWVAVLLCGLTGGLLGGLFSRLVLAAADGLPGRVGVWMRHHPVRFAAAGGVLLAVIGLVSGGSTFGTGYHQARSLVEGAAELPAVYGALKFFATLISFLLGIPGGIFAPSLSIGAGLGANLSVLVPYAPAGAVVILGMVAYFAGVIQAPITAFVIVMEMTDNHEMVVPLMAAALIAYGVSRIICPRRLYEAMSESFLVTPPPPDAPAAPKNPES
jgi:H+/Cl- antiporter ClcA